MSQVRFLVGTMRDWTVADNVCELHSRIYSVLDRMAAHSSRHLNKLRDGIECPINLKSDAAACIGLLFLVCSPTTIRRFVWPIIVFTVQRVSRARTISYIGNKLPKVIKPRIADSDASRAISRVFLGTWTIAAMDHSFVGEPQWVR